MNKILRYSFKTLGNCCMCDANSNKSIVIGRRLNYSQGLFPKTKKGITTTIVKCKNCGLIYANPLPIPLNIQDHYGIPPENYWVDSYFNIDPDYFKWVIDTFKTLYHTTNEIKSLDVGAGIGKAMIAMQNAGFDAYGIEPSESFYSRAISKMNISTEKLFLSKVEDADLPENTFDLITLSAVLEHVYEPSEVIKMCMKWLKPGGLMYIVVPSSNWLIAKLINLFYKITFSGFTSNLSPMHEPYHLYEFSKKAFIEHASRNNYSVLKYQYSVCDTFLPKFLDPFLKPLMRYTNTGMEIIVWLKKNDLKN